MSGAGEEKEECCVKEKFDGLTRVRRPTSRT
jgi:hypothetical protein